MPYLPRPDFMGSTWMRLERNGVQVNSEISWAGVLFAETQQLIDNAIYIEGLPFAQLSILAAWKKARGRQKDIRDVGLISDYLSTQ